MNEFFSNLEVRFVSLDEWRNEFQLYEKLKTLNFFKRFKKTKAFQTWKRVVKRQKFTNASNKLLENSCVFGLSDPKMRDAFLQVQALVGRLSDMGVTEILPRKTYNIKDFFARQLTLILEFGKNFGDFREGVCQLVLDTCKSTFQNNGFNYDEYSIELTWLTLNQNSPSSSQMSQIQQPRKMTFMEQVNKRKVCEKLVTFIRLIDYMLKLILHGVVCNSLLAIHKALVARAKSRAVPGNAEQKKTKDKTAEKEQEEQEIPVFTCQVSVQDRAITITPNLAAFSEGFSNLLNKLNDSIVSIPLLGNDRVFHPFTRPILYGKIVEVYKDTERTTGFSLNGHDTITSDMLEMISKCMDDAFEVCRLEMEMYEETASEFCEVDNLAEGDKKLVDVETDVDSLKSKLSNLTNQQQLAKGIKDSQIVSLFRADFRPLKRVILPNISKTIIRMQDALPKLGREKMDNFNEDCKSIKELIDFELKTTEDYVNNMDIAQRLMDRYHALESKLEGIENVYLIMKNIPVPVSTEDSNSLKNLKSQLKSIKGKVDTKVKAQADILKRFEQTMAIEQETLKETVTSLFQEVKSPTLLELDSTADEVVPALSKIGVMLQQSRGKVLQYNQYEMTYGFPVSEYFDLIAAEKVLAALRTVWKSTDEWETMYSKWANIEFSNLDVDDLKEGTALIEYELDEAKEALGDNPMSDNLREKVEKTKQRIPVLKDLRAPALKERHWKAISEIVGADLSTTSGKKITIEVLDKYSVFDFGFDISRIVKAAMLEEQLDCLINELRSTWSDQKLDMVEMHGMPTIKDFNWLYVTIYSSVETLRELGMSRYSAEMKDDLMQWCGVVEKAERFVNVLKATQDLWLSQEVPLTSMTVQDDHPWTFKYFGITRATLLKKMTKLRNAASLVEALIDEEDYLMFCDILLSLKETQNALVAALWSLRSDSPRLFFLSDNDLLQLLCKSHNNLPALHDYLDKIFPWFSSLVLVDGTDMTVSKKGYHPEISGIMSKDGETVVFEEVLKARLGVDYWIKCIGLHLRSTLREMSRKFPHEKLKRDEIMTHWTSTELPTQIQIVCIHSFWCKYFERAKVEDKNKFINFKKMVFRMEGHSVQAIRECGDRRLKTNREVAKLFLAQFYRDLMSGSLEEDETPHSFVEKLLVRYSWLEDQRIFCCKSSRDSLTPYGYEYNGQEPVFTPLLITDKVAYHVLLFMAQGDVFVVKHDVRKSLFRTLANIHGRQMRIIRPDVNPNFKEALIGGIVTNSWLFVESLDFLQAKTQNNFNFLMELTLKMENARKFGDNFVEILNKEIDLGSSVNIFISKSNLHSLLCPMATQQTIGMERYRQVSLTRPATTHRVRLGLLRRGITDNLTCIYLCSLLERLVTAFEEESDREFCLEMKMLNAINQSINTSRLGFVQQFLSLGVAENIESNQRLIRKVVIDVDLVDLMTKAARMTKEFQKFFVEHQSAAMSTAAASSHTMIENCIKLQKSISNFPITCVVANCNTTTTKRSLFAMENYLTQQTGCRIYRVCAITQLGDDDFVREIFEGAKLATGLFHVSGDVPLDKINTLRTIAAEYNTLKVLFSTRDRDVLMRIEQDVHCLLLSQDLRFDLMAAIVANLNIDLVKFIDRTFDRNILKPVQVAMEVVKELQANETEIGDRSLVMINVQSICAPMSNFISKIYESRLEKHKKVAAESEESSQASEKNGKSTEAAPVVAVAAVADATPEDLLKPKTDFLPCIVKAASIHFRNEEMIRGFVAEFKNRLEIDSSIVLPSIEELAIENMLPSNQESKKPIANLVDGTADFYIPNEETTRAACLIQFYLKNKTSVLLLGEKGCGKSLAFSKVASDFPEDMEVKYLNMTNSAEFDYEVSLLNVVRNPENCIVVVENFNLNSTVHVHFVNSLLNGRTVLDKTKAQFKQLSKFVMFVECSLPIEGQVQVPEMLAGQMVPVILRKTPNDDAAILSGVMDAVSTDFSADEDTRKMLQTLFKLLKDWHASFQKSHPNLISDHVLHRVIAGSVIFVLSRGREILWCFFYVV